MNQKDNISNEKFFGSNAKGCFYEGMILVDGEWILNAENQAIEDERQRSIDEDCHWCGQNKSVCNGLC